MCHAFDITDLIISCVRVCVCVCVCVRERERERGREGGRERERKRDIDVLWNSCSFSKHIKRMGKERKNSLKPYWVTGDDNIVYMHSESTHF